MSLKWKRLRVEVVRPKHVADLQSMLFKWQREQCACSGGAPQHSKALLSPQFVPAQRDPSAKIQTTSSTVLHVSWSPSMQHSSVNLTWELYFIVQCLHYVSENNSCVCRKSNYYLLNVFHISPKGHCNIAEYSAETVQMWCSQGSLKIMTIGTALTASLYNYVTL